MKQYTATANDEGVRLSRFVQSVTRDFPTSLLYKSFRNKRIKVNGKKGVPEDRLKAGDLIELYINDEYFEQVREEEAFRRMGYRAKFTTIDWEKKTELVDSGEIDCIWDCFSMDGRENDYQWAGPYLVSRQVIAVSAQSSIERMSDLAGKTIAVQSTGKPEAIFLRGGADVPAFRNIISLADRGVQYAMLDCSMRHNGSGKIFAPKCTHIHIFFGFKEMKHHADPPFPSLASCRERGGIACALKEARAHPEESRRTQAACLP